MATRDNAPKCGNYRTVIAKEQPAKRGEGNVQATLRSSCELGGVCRAIQAGADESFVNDTQTLTGTPEYIRQSREFSEEAGDRTCRREQLRARYR